MESLPTPPQSHLIIQHLTYLALSLATTVWVGRTLYRNGAAFLADTFIGKERLADSVNQLLLVGFYLVNGGWVVRSLKSNAPPWDASQVIENVATSYGTVLLILGVMHFGNLYVLNRMRRRAIADRSAAPVSPEQYFQPARVGA
jgi:hypothetical protein